MEIKKIKEKPISKSIKDGDVNIEDIMVGGNPLGKNLEKTDPKNTSKKGSR